MRVDQFDFVFGGSTLLANYLNVPHDAAADCWEASGAELTKEGGEVSSSKIVSAIHRKVIQ